ncbi:protoporphyrinogen oxidase [uncultured Jatrophihabitans sp.]|uniref:protoporphyrinogen oxidase n=1 Tax=uncultured Jatrophihabitans sp. TaxID=1610747 RepID=UPI0035CA6BA6
MTSAHQTPPRVVVVGGGIAGLAAAWYAAGQGASVVVLEAAAQVGGKLRTAEVGGVEVDVGAEAMLATRPEGVELLTDLGLAEQRIAPMTTSASLRAAGTNHPLPARTLMGIPTDADATRAAGVLSADALAAIDAEPALAPLAPLTEDVSVGSLVRSRLTGEIADRLVDPLLGGVYAGRADELSVQATLPALAARLADGGSLINTARTMVGAGTRAPGAGPVFTSLRGGLGRLPERLAATGRFTVRTGVSVRAIERTADGYVLTCGAVPEPERVTADAVIVAAPAAKASRLLRDVSPTAAAELGDIDSAGVAIVTFAFGPGLDLPPGSGLLVGSGERLATKAVTITSQKWPLGEAPVLVRASVGRHGEPEALRFDDADLTNLVHRELRPLLGVAARPLDTLVTRWGGALPQYGVGHVARVARIRAAVAAVPGLAVCGAAYDGVGIPACIASGRAAADRVAALSTGRGH